MGVWAVSLSTNQLSPTSLITVINVSRIRSLIGCDLLRSHEPVSALPHDITKQHYTLIYFGENQLSLSSIGILPLTSSHPKTLLRLRVRAFPHSYVGFTLLKVSSLSFGSNDSNYSPFGDAQLGHAFTSSSQLNWLN